jgi:hypothetical protein
LVSKYTSYFDAQHFLSKYNTINITFINMMD